jgi:CRISPR type III-B/RAMP module-associated protein Cmr5
MTQHEGQSQRQTTEQIRAVQAWNSILNVEQYVDQNYREDKDKDRFKGKYGSVARDLPAKIQTNGLAVTATFLYAKKRDKPEHELAYAHLSERLQHILGDNDLMEFIRSASTDKYRRATAELITYATWLKRYSEAKGWKSSEGE